ncbi:MAG: PaaI family thioesterase [Actinomycetota bacterium]
MSEDRPASETEAGRLRAATALRALSHAFAASDSAADELELVADAAGSLAARLDAAPRRDRLGLMLAYHEAGGLPAHETPGLGGRAGFDDRAVGGAANPTGVDTEVTFDGDEVVATVVLRAAFEGAPGRAHGGIVAAMFDDITGYVIGVHHTPAFTGELTVRFLAPVPVGVPLAVRARLESRERRKLFITAEARVDDEVIATCRAIYIAVDPGSFRGAPDPR